MIDHLEYDEVTPNIFRTAMKLEESHEVVRPYLTSNMSCIALPDELIFVDCGSRTDFATKFRQDMERHFERETTHLILTDKVWDKIYGMNAFKDVKIVCTSQTKSIIRQNLKQGVTMSMKELILRQIREDDQLRENLLNHDLFVPNLGFSKQIEIGSEPNNLELRKTIFAGALIVYYPSEKTFLSGNCIQSCKPPFLWSITGVEAYRKWESLSIDYIVPGYGPVVNKNFLISIREWMDDVLEKLRKYKGQGISLSKIHKQDFPDHPAKKRISWIEGSPYHTEVIENMLKYWYKQILKEKEEVGDLIFIS